MILDLGIKPYYSTTRGDLYHADCLDILPKIPDKAVDLCLTDPPYGVNLQYASYSDTEENWFKLMIDFIPLAKQKSKMVIMPSCQIKRLDFIYKNFPPDWLICWYKGSTGCSAYVGFNDWEPLLVYGKTEKQLYMHDYIAVACDEKMGNYGHPCPKPLLWSKTLIQKATKENDLILDPFSGSGTTAVACEDLNRRWICIEKEERYCQLSATRIENFLKQGKLF